MYSIGPNYPQMYSIGPNPVKKISNRADILHKHSYGESLGPIKKGSAVVTFLGSYLS